jgi:hypothetical protein
MATIDAKAKFADRISGKTVKLTGGVQIAEDYVKLNFEDGTTVTFTGDPELNVTISFPQIEKFRP